MNYKCICSNKIKLEQWRRWRRRRRRRLVVPETIRQKRRRTRTTTHLWSHVHDHLTKLLIIRRKSLRFFGEMGRMLLQDRELLRLGAQYQLWAPNGWDTTSRPQVLGHSVGESVHPISIGLTRKSYLHPQIWIEILVGRRIVPVSLHQPIIICFL
jgi:hypothetical protein